MAEPIPISGRIALDPDEIEMSFIRSSGPGGQNVNKVSSAVQLRFDIANSPSLPAPVRTRALKLAGARATKEGLLVLLAEGSRSQARNREDAIERLLALLRAAAVPPTPRIKTRPTLASKRKRLETKTKRGATKALRRPPSAD